MPFPYPSSSKRIPSVRSYIPKDALGSSNATVEASDGLNKSKRKSRGFRLRPHTLVFALAYVVVLYFVVSTIGQPYKDFLTRAEEEGMDVLENDALLRAEAEHKFKDISSADRITGEEASGWFSWVGMDAEDYEAAKKKEKEKSVLDALPKKMRVPNKYMPGFWPLLFLGITATLHALFFLMQVWKVSFDAAVNYVEVDVMDCEQEEVRKEIEIYRDRWRGRGKESPQNPSSNSPPLPSRPPPPTHPPGRKVQERAEPHQGDSGRRI